MYIFNRIYLVKYIIVNVYVYTKRRKSIFNDLDTSYNFLDIKTLQYCWENIQICNVCIYIQKAEKARNMRMEDTFSTLIHQMCCVCVCCTFGCRKNPAPNFTYIFIYHTRYQQQQYKRRLYIHIHHTYSTDTTYFHANINVRNIFNSKTSNNICCISKCTFKTNSYTLKHTYNIHAILRCLLSVLPVKNHPCNISIHPVDIPFII